MRTRTLYRTLPGMKSISATQARKNLYRLLDEVSATSQPIQITGRRSNAILISGDDWRSLQETLYLLSIPGLRESVRDGLATDLGECLDEPEW